MQVNKEISSENAELFPLYSEVIGLEKWKTDEREVVKQKVDSVSLCV